MNPSSPQTFNRYGYVQGDPVNLLDPTALQGSDDPRFINCLKSIPWTMFPGFGNDWATMCSGSGGYYGMAAFNTYFAPMMAAAGAAIPTAEQQAKNSAEKVLEDPKHPNCAGTATGLNDLKHVAQKLQSSKLTFASLGPIQVDANGIPTGNTPDIAVAKWGHKCNYDEQ